MLNDFLLRLRSLFRRSDVERELDDELRFHFDRQVEKFLSSGLPLAEARRRARLTIGGSDQIKEEYRESSGVRFLETLWQDLRFALRMLRKSPGFATVAVLTLALGIGANTAIFSAVDAILLKPPPYTGFSRLVEIVSEKISGGAGMIAGGSIPIARDIESQCPAFDGLVTYYFGQSYTLTDQPAPELLSGTAVSGNFFTFLGVRPLLGRPILESDTKPGNSYVVVLSYDVWNALFGRDPDLIGRKITLTGKQYTVVGVMPPKFDMEISPNHGFWLPRVPKPSDATDRTSHSLGVLARLKPGITIGAAQVELSTVSARLAAEYPKTDAGWKLLARDPYMADSQIREGLLLLLGAAGFVLVIACVNVSGLLLARGWGRRREVAIREALGATRGRIIRQFLSESALLGLFGGALGLLFSVWAIRVLRVLIQPYTSNIDDIKLNLAVLTFTLGIALLAGILFGVVPATQVSARHLGAALKENLGGALAGVIGRSSRTLRSILVIIEVTLAVMLVIGAALVGRSFENLTSVNLGFRTDHVLTLGVNFSKPVCDPSNTQAVTQCALAINDVLAQVQSLRGVESAAVASSIPSRGATIGIDVNIEGQTQEIGFSEGSPVFERNVSPEFFDAMRMRVLQGRIFTKADINGAERVALVNETFARKFLSGKPLGKRMSEQKDKHGHPEWMTIVGEVNDSRDWRADSPVFPEFYTPYAQDNDIPAVPNLIVRTAGDPMAMAAAVKQQIWSVDKDAPVTGLATMDQIVSDEVAEPRFQAVLLGSFGVLGLVLAMVGIYGVISYSVTQRTHEIGVRMALGAQPANVLRMVIREGMLLAGVGIVAGVSGAWALGRVLQSLLFEIKPTDPATFIGVAILLTLVALAACYIPARRAMKVDPMVALRYE